MKVIGADASYQEFGASNCVVFEDGDCPTPEEIVKYARRHNALIPGDPAEEADDGDLVIIQRHGRQEALDQDGVLAISRGLRHCGDNPSG